GRALRHRGRQANRPGILWKNARAFVFRRLLERWTPSADGGATVSHRLQRHHRRSTRARLYRIHDELDLECTGAETRTYPGQQGAYDRGGRAGRMRRQRRPPGWPDQRPAALSVQSEKTPMHGRRWVKLPDTGRSANAAEDLRRNRELRSGADLSGAPTWP